MTTLTRCLLVLALLTAPALAFATAEEAKAAYMRGAAKEKAKDYEGALAEYDASLAAFPGYVYANKQKGNCLYMLGRKDEAVEQYEIYLAKMPNDAATRKFSDGIKAQLAAAPAAEKPSRRRKKGREADPKAGTMGLNPSFYMGFGFGYQLMNDGSDIKKLYGSGVNPTVSSYAISPNLHLGYQFSNGLAVEGGYESFNRFATTSFSSGFGSNQVLFFFSESVFFLEPLYRFQLASRMTLDAGLKLGYASMSVQSSSIGTSGGGSSPVFTGSGLIYMPEARIQFMLGRKVGLHLGAGYRMDSISPVKSASGFVQPDNSGGNWVANSSGLDVRLGLDIYFSKLVN